MLEYNEGFKNELKLKMSKVKTKTGGLLGLFKNWIGLIRILKYNLCFMVILYIFLL